jgi:xanthine dehydrogenase molybdenum-binding subunit
MGTNAFSSLAQVAAEVLGLSFEDVKVVWGDTDVTMWEKGSFASSTMYLAGQAVQKAASEARDKILMRAARKLGVTTDKLDIKKRRVFVRQQSEKDISIAEIAKEAIYNLGVVEQITGTCSFQPSTSPPSYQAAFSEVEVDTETGQVKVLKMVLVNDSGVAVNPMTVEGQLEGGAVQGLGYSLWEEPVMDVSTGRLLTDDFDTYKIPTSLDVPELETVLLEQAEPTGPFGAKGVGEPGGVNIAASIANAIYNAVNIRMWQLPITPEKVLKALKAR